MSSANREQIGEVTIGARFNGPGTSANGGYACGSLAGFVGEPAEVTLRRPPPLEHVMAVIANGDGGALLFDGETLVAEAKPAELPELEPPLRPSFEQALDARSRHPAKGIPHPLSGCFVCSPSRPDGLGVVPGPIDAEADVGAAPFEPGESVAEQGIVRPEIVWSVLDCPSYTPSMWQGGIVNGGPVSLLGRFTAERLRDVAVGEQLVVVGWPIGSDGRKRHTASALIDADRQVAAQARSTWIELRA